MMKFLKTIVGLAGVVLFIALITFTGSYMFFYDSFDDLSADYRLAKRAVKLELFNRGYLEEISQDDFRYIYQKKCYRQCHGEAAMITAVLSPAGWFQVVERMRLKENVKISGREADVIIKYLEQNYPTTKSGFSYEVRKEVHNAVWRHDLGQGDIYSDVIYVTPEYLQSIGAEHLIDEYDLKNYHVFITSFSVHEGEVELFNLDKVAVMRSGGREIKSTPFWILRFQTADKHHFEAVVRFARKGDPPIVDENSKEFELVLKNIGGEPERVLKWELPIAYPPEVLKNQETAQNEKVVS
ncbi:MAG: hypothetical protein ACE5EN_00060 [Nitrospinota bacterium]